MQSQTPGIKSLNDRVIALEVSSGVTSQFSSFADKLISNVTSNIKSDLQKVLDHYEEGLTNLGIDIGNFKMVDLVKAVPYTVTYIETNAASIAKILIKDATSAFKLNTALTFLQNLIQPGEDFLISWIEHEVDLLFNMATNTLSDTLQNTKAKKVKPAATGSVSRASAKNLFKIGRKSKQ